MKPGRGRALTSRYAALAGMLELAIALPMPVLILHMTGRGLDIATVGLAFTIRALLVAVLELPTGGLADAIGRRPVALASQLFTLASFAVLLFVIGPVTAIVYAILQGVGSALHSGAMDAWFVDELGRLEPTAPLQPHLAAVDVAQAAGMLAGSAIGGLLPSLAAPLGLPWPLAGFGIALAAGVSVRVIVWFCTLALVQEPSRARPSARVLRDGVAATPRILGDALRLSRDTPVIRWLLVAAAASGLAMVSVETFWQPIAATVLGASAADSQGFAILGTLAGVAVLGGSLVVMRYGQGFPGGEAALAGVSLLLRGGAMLLFAVSASRLGLAAGLGIVYFALATSNVPHDTLLHKAVPSGRRSSMLSVHSLVFSLGIAVASGPLGWLASTTSPRLALWVAGLATICACGAYAAIGRLPAAAQRHQAARPEPRGGSGALADALLLDDTSVPEAQVHGVRR
ncbi:MAG TPA: MFS transporter [Trueperaceae bacterium]